MNDFKVPTMPLPSAKAEDPNVVKETEKTAVVPQKQPTQNETEAPRERAEAPKKTVAPPSTAGTCPYKIPPWSAPPPAQHHYKFEVLKSGQIIEEVPDLQLQAIWKFGRLPANDVEMAHPTISRFHAILQYRPKVPPQQEGSDAVKDEKVTAAPLTQQQQQPADGWYIYDLDSTHGTFLNKQRVPARVFIRVRVGHMIKLGASSRSYILAGPDEDAEPESELSVTQLRAQRQQQAEEAAVAAQCKAEEAEQRKQNEGISWGMQEDADEETDLTHNPYAASNNEDLFLDDPKRTLRGYFEREGLDLEYKCDEMSAGSFVCRVELPLDDANGRSLIAEVVHKGRKKECVVQCALEACRILDRHGVLRQANQEPLKRKLKTQDSDSDGDEFWDRTGDILRKKLRKANAGVNVTLTYDDLLKQEAELTQQLEQVDTDIAKYQVTQKRLKEAKAHQEQEVDELDSFMEKLSDGATQLDKTEIRKLRLEQQRLKAETQKLQRLIKIAKPIDLPFVKATQEAATSNQEGAIPEVSKKQLPMVGKRNQFSKFKVVKMTTSTTATNTQTENSNVFDKEEENEDVKLELNAEHKTVDKKEISIPELKQNVEKATMKKLSTPENVPVKNYVPALIPQNGLENGDSKADMEVDESTTSTTKQKNQMDDAEKDLEVESNVADSEKRNEELDNKDDQSKKRRQRHRLRHKRHEDDNDELDAHESSEKYAKWVPPANQCGDGYTKLNDKYGY